MIKKIFDSCQILSGTGTNREVNVRLFQVYRFQIVTGTYFYNKINISSSIELLKNIVLWQDKLNKKTFPFLWKITCISPERVRKVCKGVHSCIGVQSVHQRFYQTVCHSPVNGNVRKCILFYLDPVGWYSGFVKYYLF